MKYTSSSSSGTSRATVAPRMDQDIPDLVAADEVRHEGEVTWCDWGRSRTLRDQHLRRISAGRWNSAPAQSDPSYYLG